MATDSQIRNAFVERRFITKINFCDVARANTSRTGSDFGANRCGRFVEFAGASYESMFSFQMRIQYKNHYFKVAKS